VVAAADYARDVLKASHVHLLGYSFGATVAGAALDARPCIATYTAGGDCATCVAVQLTLTPQEPPHATTTSALQCLTQPLTDALTHWEAHSHTHARVFIHC
jgi:alpha/beta superfamily hydrolase